MAMVWVAFHKPCDAPSRNKAKFWRFDTHFILTRVV